MAATLPDTRTGDARPRLSALYAALWQHARGRRAQLLAALALLASAEVLRLAVPWFTGRAINTLQQQGAAGLAIAGLDLLMVFATIAAGWALHAPGRLLERNVALQVRRSYSAELLERLLHAPLGWHLQQHSGQTAHRVSQSSEALHTFAENQYVYVQNAVMLVGPLAALWLISPWVGLWASVGFALLGSVSLALDRLLIRLALLRNEAERRYQAAWLDTLGHVLTVFALRRFEGARRLILARLDALALPLRRMVVLNEAKWATVDVCSALLWCSLVALYAALASRGDAAGAAGAAAGGIALGSLYMVYDYARRAEQVMTVIAGDFSQLADQQANFSAAAPLLQAPQQPLPISVSNSRWQTLALDAVAPARDGSQRQAAGFGTPVLQLQLHRGLRYALVGRSGAGKSTLLRLLAGLEPPAAGSLQLDGAAIDSERLRSEATLVPQEAQLFAGTLAENLLMDAASLAPGLARALALAGADEIVQALPQGLQTAVAEGGADWSGGQRQRLALARGLLAAEGSSLLLLDEPTNGLDLQAEARTLARLLDATGSACTVVALHRLSLLPLFDEVIVMDAGQVLDIGPVDSVLRRCPLLREMAGEPDAATTPPPAAPAFSPAA